VTLQLPEGLTLQVPEPVVHLLEGPITLIRDWFAEQLSKDVERLKTKIWDIAKVEVQEVKDKCAKFEAELILLRKKKGRK
jgi:hypothetical protein